MRERDDLDDVKCLKEIFCNRIHRFDSEGLDLAIEIVKSGILKLPDDNDIIDQLTVFLNKRLHRNITSCVIVLVSDIMHYITNNEVIKTVSDHVDEAKMLLNNAKFKPPKI
jgi:hypothetical protein